MQCKNREEQEGLVRMGMKLKKHKELRSGHDRSRLGVRGKHIGDKSTDEQALNPASQQPLERRKQYWVVSEHEKLNAQLVVKAVAVGCPRVLTAGSDVGVEADDRQQARERSGPKGEDINMGKVMGTAERA
ncbi:hypothetical protein K438DRAFT_1754239 [Mycena galopus ATCC 62051]|nr:hypothetical protein K438DRAFT_1754239 [Mycena galopus ATCC 62051]